MERYQLPAVAQNAFARTNVQTIAQRVRLVRELQPDVKAIGEICCGDCSAQWQAYRDELGITNYLALDLMPEIVAHNRALGIDCRQGDALSELALRDFLRCPILFFGPPLSLDCDGHRLLDFAEVTPGFIDFATLLFGTLRYSGTLVCIGPRGTTPGDVQRLYAATRAVRPEVGLRLLHYSYARVTGRGVPHEERLKYVEAWLSSSLEDRWEVRHSRE